MALRPIVLASVALLLAGPLLYVAVRWIRGGIPPWKRPMAAGAYLVLLGSTTIELTDATAVASAPRLALALDVLAALASLYGMVLFVRSWRLRRRSDDRSSSG